jgi:hypothetical protein
MHGLLFVLLETCSLQQKMEEGGGHYVDPTTSVQDVLTTLQSTPTLFKNLINFITTKFEDLTSIVVPTIISHAQSTSDTFTISKRPSKLNHEQRFPNYFFLQT